MTKETTRPILPVEEGTGPLSTSAPAVPRRTDYAWAVVFKINIAIAILSGIYNAGSVVVPASFAYGASSFGWLFARSFLRRVLSYDKGILKAGYVSFAAISGLAAVIALATGAWLAWIVPALLCAWSIRFFLKNRNRIIFSSANLKVAVLAVKSMPWAVPTGLVLCYWQVVWAMLSVAAAWGSITSLHTVTTPDGTTRSALDCHNEISDIFGHVDRLICKCGVGGFIMWPSPCVIKNRPVGSIVLGCFWLVVLTWIAAVVRNLVSIAVTASVTSWWISPEGEKSHVESALRRAGKESLGSVCKAAAVDTVARLPIMAMRRLSQVCRYWNFPLERLRNAEDFVLTSAIYFVGIDGVDFSEASRRVSELVRRRGATAIANDIVVDVGLAGLVLGATAFFMALLLLLLRAITDDLLDMGGLSRLYGMPVAVLSVSYLVAVIVATALEVLRSALKAVVICFQKDPEALATNHGREIYDELSKAWHEMQAECLEVDSDEIRRVWHETEAGGLLAGGDSDD